MKARIAACAIVLLAVSEHAPAQETRNAATGPVREGAAATELESNGTYGEVILEGDACCPNAGVLLQAKATKASVVAKSGTSDASSGFSVFNSANAELLRVRSDGVIALGGATASPWNVVLTPALEYLNTSIAFGDVTDLHFNSNAYFDGKWRYKSGNAAANYHMHAGWHYWRVGPAGVAGAELPWVYAMNIANSGNVGIGIEQAAASATLQVTGTAPVLRVSTPGSTPYAFVINDTVSEGYAGGVILDLQGNSFLRSGGIDVGHLGSSLIRTHTTPLQLNAQSSQDVVIGSADRNTRLRVDGRGLSTFAGAVSVASNVSVGTGAAPVHTLDVGGNMTVGSGYGSAASVPANGLIVEGSVGIGVPAPLAKLHVGGEIRATTIRADTVLGAVYQDLAEWVPATADLAPGTVVVLNPDRANEVMPSESEYDGRVAGVVSAQPGILLGEGGATKEMVATTGRVKVKVDATRGAIRIGDLLVSSGKTGTAMKSQPIDVGGVAIHRPGTIIGKALEPLESGEGEILVLLSMQ